jgi:putative tricarboxylic transport membrane protein
VAASFALTLKNILYCFMGALIGVLAGIGPLATIAMLMPFTYHVDPVSSMIMLAGIFYGAQSGGSTTSILLNLPGEASSVITCLDGHQLAKKGKAGVALSVAAVGSLVAGTLAR